MKTIAFFISDHGYGHIMRNAPLIQWLLTNSDVHIMVVSGENHINALKIYLGKTIDKEIIDSRMVSISMNTDLGIIVKTGSLRIDSEAMVIKVAHYLGNFPALVQKGEAIIVENNVNLCVVDIVPWALEAASNCNVPSVLMASFTWIEQYENFIPSYLLEPFKCLYLKADKVIKYHLSTRMVNKIYPNSKEYGYCCRSANGFEPVCPKSYFKNNYQTVFITLGMSNDGINGMIDVSHLPYNFFVCEGLNLIGENVYVVPKGSANSHLFMMASDYCIAKAGWSSISEFIIAHKHMALIQRDEVSEDSDYIELLVKENLAIKIDISEIKTVGEVIEKMKRFKWSESKYSDDTSRICMEILTG